MPRSAIPARALAQYLPGSGQWSHCQCQWTVVSASRPPSPAETPRRPPRVSQLPLAVTRGGSRSRSDSEGPSASVPRPASHRASGSRTGSGPAPAASGHWWPVASRGAGQWPRLPPAASATGTGTTGSGTATHQPHQCHWQWQPSSLALLPVALPLAVAHCHCHWQWQLPTRSQPGEGGNRIFFPRQNNNAADDGGHASHGGARGGRSTSALLVLLLLVIFCFHSVSNAPQNLNPLTFHRLPPFFHPARRSPFAPSRRG
jgi:hypothetical protein